MSVINTNIKSMVAQNALTSVNRDLSTAMERLSTGSRINSAKDDAAGLSIATRMTSQTRGLSMAIRNANDGISLLQTSEGALGEVTGALQRMRELAVQSVNGTNNASDRAALDAEVQQLKSEIDRIASTTEFNSQKILDGSFKDKVLQIGDKADQTLEINIGSVKTQDLGMGGAAGAANSLVSARATLGAVAAGAILINGQELGEIEAGDDMEAVLANINSSVDNVKASAFNTVVMKNGGDGVAADGDITIAVTAPGAATATTVTLSESNSMEELVANINAESGGIVEASLNDEGKLVLSNATGSAIVITDSTTGGAASGIGVTTATTFNGFIKLESEDGSPVRIERGNLGMAEPGSLTDLAKLGFREVTSEPSSENYTVTGEALTDTGISTAWGRTDLNINGTAIYDADVDTSSLAGKLNAINNFTAETGVFASAEFEKSFTIPSGGFSENTGVAINGVTIDTGADVATFATNINAQTSAHGLVATVNGDNLILSGSNVQKATIDYVDPAAMGRVASSVSATGAIGAARTIAFKSADIVAGRTLELAIASTGQTGSVAVTYTMKAGDTKTSVAFGIKQALLDTKMTSGGLLKGADIPQFRGTNTGAVIAANGVLTISATAYGSAKISLSFVASPSDAVGHYETTITTANAAHATARVITFASGDLIAGQTYELRIAGGKKDGATGSSTTVRVTATSSDKAVFGEAVRTALLASEGAYFGQDNTFNRNGQLSAAAVTHSAGVVTIAGATGYGAATITFKAVDAVLGGKDSYNAAIRLDSVDNQPIAIALGDSQDVGEHGLLEQNVGAADYQVNEPTLGVAVGSSLKGLNVATAVAANKAIGTVDNAIEKVSAMRADMGAVQNRLDRAVDNLSNVLTNTEASRSRIADTDYATETTMLAKSQIIQQAATAMLAQANQSSQSVMALLQ